MRSVMTRSPPGRVVSRWGCTFCTLIAGAGAVPRERPLQAVATCADGRQRCSRPGRPLAGTLSSDHRLGRAARGPHVISDSLVSSHSAQIQSPERASSPLSSAGIIVTPQAGQIRGRSSSRPPSMRNAGWALGLLVRQNLDPREGREENGVLEDVVPRHSHAAERLSTTKAHEVAAAKLDPLQARARERGLA